MSDQYIMKDRPQSRPFTYDPSLPIHQKREEIVDSIRTNPVTIVAGETGSGKTTQLPLMCLEAGRGVGGRIGCTQPRRIAAVSLAAHVAEAFGSDTGRDVGYKVRFSDSVSSQTRIKFVTDGMLLAELGQDKLLREYDTIIVDEAHERSVNIDFLLGYFRTLLHKRPELRLIISSATIDTNLFSRAFNHAPVVYASGRMYQVDIRYQPAIELWQGNRLDGYMEGAVQAIRSLLESDDSGDMLVFLPTTEDIREVIARIRPLAEEKNREVLPLHSRLPIAEQSRIFNDPGKPRIVVSTNIAETSLTVPNIKYVIDSGLARVSRYDPSAGITRMPIQPVSRASASQRAGRCGRVRDGICIRLYSEKDFNNRPAFSLPEIKRCNLAGVLLQMAYLGLGNASTFPFLQRPGFKAINDGIHTLRLLGAFNRKAHLTHLGKKMARLPLDPPVARMLLYAQKLGVVEEITVIASALSIDDPLLGSDNTHGSGKSNTHPDSDFLTYLNLWKKYRGNCRSQPPVALKSFCEQHGLSLQRMREWQYTHKQISRICKRLLQPPKNFSGNRSPRQRYAAVHQSLLAGLIGNCAVRQDNGLYRGLQEHDIMVHPSSTLFRKKPRWILFHQLVETKRLYGRVAAIIKPQWIEEVYPKRCRHHFRDPWFDEETGRVKAHEEVSFGRFLLVQNRHIDLKEKDASKAREIFIREALVNERIGDSFRFIRHNRRIIDNVLIAQQKLRTHSIYKGDWVIEQFYSDQLPENIYSMHDLLGYIHRMHDDTFLFLQQHVAANPVPQELKHYPDTIRVGDYHLPVRYRFDRQSAQDGAEIRVPYSLYRSLPSWYWEWLLPVYKRQRIEYFLSLIGDDLHKKGIEAVEAHKRLEQALHIAYGPFQDALIDATRDTLGLSVDSEEIPVVLFPNHLWPLITVHDTRGEVLDSFRPPGRPPQLPIPESGKRESVWEICCSKWERIDIDEWDWDTLPDLVPVASPGQLQPCGGIPALTVEGSTIALRVFWSRPHAQDAHAAAVRVLMENSLAEELAWSETELSLPLQLVRNGKRISDSDILHEAFKRIFREYVLALPPTLPRSRKAFVSCISRSADRLKHAETEIISLLERCVERYINCNCLIQSMVKKHRGTFHRKIADDLKEEITDYGNRILDARLPFAVIRHLPEDLDCLYRRIEVAFLHTGSYRKKMETVTKLRSTLKEASKRSDFVNQHRLAILYREIEQYTHQQFSTKCKKKQLLLSADDILAHIRSLKTR